MDSSVKLLLTINDGVKGILMELKCLKKIKYFIKFDMHLYEEALQVMNDKIDIFYEAFNSGILNHRAISLSILNIINLHLNEIQSTFIKIKKWNHKVSKKGVRKLFTLYINNPSKMKALLQKKMDSIIPHLYELQELERTIFGTAIRIKQKILRKAWMLVGGNQLNDSFLPKNLFCENLYMLLKSEGGGELKRKDFWKEKIKLFVDDLDGSACTEIDDKLSVAELNEIPDDLIYEYSVMELILNFTKKTEPSTALMLTNLSDVNIDVNDNNDNNDNNEKEVLMIEDKSELKEVIKEIELNFDEQIFVNHRNKVMIPKCKGYGANWPSKLCIEFIIPELPDDRYQLFYVKIKLTSYDQKWGGTGHCQVRYQINNEMPIIGFSVNTEKNKENEYEIRISGENIKVGNIVKIWACCPPWSGWEIIVDKINAFVYYS
jgi:hypothetical protein